MLERLNFTVLYPVLVGLFMLIVFDISTRLINTETAKPLIWKSDNDNTQINEKLRFNQEQADAINHALNNYEQETLATTNTNTNGQAISEAEKLAQQGNLNQLYAGDFRYRLVGVFKEKISFAIIQQYNVKTKVQQLIKLKQTEHINNYQISTILANSVLLKSSNKRQIKLFLYKTKTKTKTKTSTSVITDSK